MQVFTLQTKNDMEIQGVYSSFSLATKAATTLADNGYKDNVVILGIDVDFPQ